MGHIQCVFFLIITKWLIIKKLCRQKMKSSMLFTTNDHPGEPAVNSNRIYWHSQILMHFARTVHYQAF